MVVYPTSNPQHGGVLLTGCPHLPPDILVQTFTSNRNQTTRHTVLTTDPLDIALGTTAVKLTVLDQWYQQDVLDNIILSEKYLNLQMHVYWTPN
jgi:hypothetical protein